MSEDNALNAFFKSYADGEEEFGFKLANETLGEKVPVIKTGALVLDDALSCGGLPKGRVIQYYGPSASGKSLMAMLAILDAQKEDPTAMQTWIDAEGTFDTTWAATLGIDCNRVLLITDDNAVNGRKLFEMLLGVPKEDAKTHELKGKSKEGLLDKIKNKEININYMVLDSLGAIIPPGEDTAKIGKMNMALMARFLTTTFKKLSLEVKEANIPFLIINHKRDNMDPYGADHTYSGGNTYTHTLSANVYFTKINAKDKQILDENEETIGHTIRATIEKSKFGPHPRKCEFKVKYLEGVVDVHEQIVELGLKYNIINRPNQVSYEIGEQKWRGKDAFYTALAEDVNLQTSIIDQIEKVREDQLDLLRNQQQNAKQEVLSAASEPKKRGRKKEEAAE
jgi:recombination protein RecA